MPNYSLDDRHHDGIEELDNPLPRWWVYLFYVTIIFSIGYAPYYWFKGPTAAETLAQEMNQGAPKKDATQSTQSLAVLVKESSRIEAGKLIYVAKCAACHGPDGGGLIGPNLTDRFWIHGKGTPNDIMKVVTEGVPAKGMLAWGTLLSPDDLVAVVAYVNSLGGTTPSNPKAAEGTEIQ